MTLPFLPPQFAPCLFLSKLRKVGHKRSAFTLIETALALGIVAFALVPLVGLLPVGLQVSKDASDLTISAQIAQRLAGMAQQTDEASSTLRDGTSALMTSYFAFDNEGQPVAASNGSQTASSTSVPANPAVYSAAVLHSSNPSPTGAVTVLIQIVNDPGQALRGQVPAAKMPAGPGSRLRPVFIPVYLTDNGK